MSLNFVLGAVQFWSSGKWDTYLSYVPVTLNSTEQDIFTSSLSDSIQRVYLASTTAATIFDAWALSGPINIGNAGDVFAYYLKADFNTMLDSNNDEYIAVNPNKTAYTIDKTGNLFVINSDVILAHELGHRIGTEDAAYDVNLRYAPDIMMNASGYNYNGSALEFEQQISRDLGIAQTRTSYHTIVFTDDERFIDLFSHAGSFTGSNEVDIIRFGDQSLSPMANIIDMSTSSAQLGTLVFGFAGSDTVTGSSMSDWIYGGTDNDVIDGWDGSDNIHGENGNDLITDISKQAEMNILRGGDGHDIIIANNAEIWGGEGNDRFWFQDHDNQTEVYSAEYDLRINDASVGDAIYWNGYQLTGGQYRYLDIEIRTNYDDYGPLADPDTGLVDQYLRDVVYCIDEHGAIYTQYSAGLLRIALPSGGVIQVDNFTDGIAGVTMPSVGYMITTQGQAEQYPELMWDDGTQKYSYAGSWSALESTLEIPAGAFDGMLVNDYHQFDTWQNITGWGDIPLPTAIM